MPSLFPSEGNQPVVLSYGMGIDSTALLLRWLQDPDSRDFNLNDLVCLTAQTGNEFMETGRLVEAHILPLLREFRVRFVQVARSGFYQSDGITVLDDSRQPEKLYIEGDFKLSDELTMNGTIPQVATGQRRCTHHHKGFPLSGWTDREYGDQPIRKAIGYNADEIPRVLRSEGYSTDSRALEYPLVEWAWNRQKCEDYVRDITGETWRKSLCVFCPFASGKPDILQRYRQSPAEAAEALFLEYLALAMNERMSLYSKKSLRSVLEKDGNTEALRLLEAKLNEVPWAIYRVRRILWARGRGDRKTERLKEGMRETIVTELVRQGAARNGDHVRLEILRRGDTYPALEESLVAAPAVVENKSRPKFDENWANLSGAGPLF